LKGILIFVFRQNLEQSGTSFDSFSERQGPRMYDGGARKIQVQFFHHVLIDINFSDKRSGANTTKLFSSLVHFFPFFDLKIGHFKVNAFLRA
jgi:hypothetical protein